MSADEPDYPYVNHTNILYDKGELVDVAQLVRDCTDQWYNQTLCQVNDTVVRLGVLEGEYHWHTHKEEDEFFFVVSGELLIQLKDDRSVTLGKNQGFVVAKGLLHRPIAATRTVVLMAEPVEITPTGTVAEDD